MGKSSSSTLLIIIIIKTHLLNGDGIKSVIVNIFSPRFLSLRLLLLLLLLLLLILCGKEGNCMKDFLSLKAFRKAQKNGDDRVISSVQKHNSHSPTDYIYYIDFIFKRSVSIIIVRLLVLMMIMIIIIIMMTMMIIMMKSMMMMVLKNGEIHPSIYSGDTSIYTNILLSIHLSIYLSIHPSVPESIYIEPCITFQCLHRNSISYIIIFNFFYYTYCLFSLIVRSYIYDNGYMIDR